MADEWPPERRAFLMQQLEVIGQGLTVCQQRLEQEQALTSVLQQGRWSNIPAALTGLSYLDSPLAKALTRFLSECESQVGKRAAEIDIEEFRRLEQQNAQLRRQLETRQAQRETRQVQVEGSDQELDIDAVLGLYYKLVEDRRQLPEQTQRLVAET